MRNFLVLSDALNYIEEHLRENISQQDIADNCFVSLSCLQKLFRYAFNTSIALYITRRRITCCAELLLSTDRTALDIALEYGYNSAEVFSRAFTRIWGESPASFRKTHRFAGLYPRLDPCQPLKGAAFMIKDTRKYDVSGLYDYLSDHRNTYILIFDIKGLIPINEISNSAGDEAIRESLRRIEAAAGEDMLFFRVGGDEFVLTTNTSDEAAADAIAAKVTSRNGETFSWNGRDIPLALWSAKLLIPETSVRYSQLFPDIYNALITARGC